MPSGASEEAGDCVSVSCMGATRPACRLYRSDSRVPPSRAALHRIPHRAAYVCQELCRQPACAYALRLAADDRDEVGERDVHVDHVQPPAGPERRPDDRARVAGDVACA